MLAKQAANLDIRSVRQETFKRGIPLTGIPPLQGGYRRISAVIAS
jgi:hypothetical protein